MGKSARVLGKEFGRTARDMNALLKEYGYLDGSPGAYGLTEKGQQYAKEQYHSRGTGGYAQYNPSWETRTWSEETVAALRADMEANPGGCDDAGSPAEEDALFEPEPIVDHSGSGGDDDPQLSWKELTIGGAVVVAILVAPHAKPFWNSKVKPVAKKMRDKLTKQESTEATES
ncbi:VOC family protein [Streptomyces rubrogriseus]|uniref:hypothetical protein n=1 Tax=Streptomyces rubrogriseus TaxID=194673 RepID=UPI00368ED6EC